MSALTADLCARALIAAAKVFGDDPLRVCTARSGRARRALHPAIVAIGAVLKLPLTQAASPFGVHASNIPGQEKRSALFVEAQAAAEGVLLAWVEPLDACVGSGAPSGATIARPANVPGGGAALVETSAPPAAPRGSLALPPMMAPGRVRREVLAVLAEDPSTGPDLMQLVGVGEGQIREALSALKEQGRVACTAMTQEGWAAQFWRLAE